MLINVLEEQIGSIFKVKESVQYEKSGMNIGSSLSFLYVVSLGLFFYPEQ
jgi:hypothetical protein